MQQDGAQTIGYLSGPVDGVAVHDAFQTGQPLAYLGTSYLLEFFEECAGTNANGVVITSEDTGFYSRTFDRFTVVNLSKPPVRGGLFYHADLIGWTWTALSVLNAAGVDTLILTDVQNYWFLTAFHAIRRARLIPAIHCVLDRPYAPTKPAHRILHWLNKHLFYRRLVQSALVASPVIERQLQSDFGQIPLRSAVFLPDYREEDFAAPFGRDPEPGPFLILSAGRLEESKGAMDIVAMAQILEQRGEMDFRFEVCGTGAGEAAMRREIARLGLAHRITLNGFCDKQRLLDLFGKAHAVVVPTRSSFEEGFAMICAEAIAAGRPLVTSRVCPALEVVAEAAEEATIDDPASYADAIQRLVTNPALYQQKRDAAARIRSKFFDKTNSYGWHLRRVLAAEPEREEVATGSLGLGYCTRSRPRSS